MLVSRSGVICSALLVAAMGVRLAAQALPTASNLQYFGYSQADYKAGVFEEAFAYTNTVRVHFEETLNSEDTDWETSYHDQLERAYNRGNYIIAYSPAGCPDGSFPNEQNTYTWSCAQILDIEQEFWDAIVIKQMWGDIGRDTLSMNESVINGYVDDLKDELTARQLAYPLMGANSSHPVSSVQAEPEPPTRPRV